MTLFQRMVESPSQQELDPYTTPHGDLLVINKENLYLSCGDCGGVFPIEVCQEMSFN